MSKKIVSLTLFSMFLLSAMVVTSVVAQPRVVGVNVGDWGEYAIFYSGNATFPPQLPFGLEWMKLTVQEIFGTNITYEHINHYANGTEEDGINSVDVDTGQGNGIGFFIAANLTAGELIYTSPPPSGPFGLNFGGATINETVSKLYAGETVKTNHLNITRSESYPELNMTTSQNFYWYKATGMVAEMSVSVLYQWAGGNITWLEWRVAITAVIPEFPQFLIMPLFMLTTLLIVIVYRRKHSM